MTVSLEELMRYHDGELSPEEASRVERALACDENARAELRAFELTGELVRDYAEKRSAAHADLVDGVMERIARDRASRQTRAQRLLPLAASALALAAAVSIFVTTRGPDRAS